MMRPGAVMRFAVALFALALAWGSPAAAADFSNWAAIVVAGVFASMVWSVVLTALALRLLLRLLGHA